MSTTLHVYAVRKLPYLIQYMQAGVAYLPAFLCGAAASRGSLHTVACKATASNQGIYEPIL